MGSPDLKILKAIDELKNNSIDWLKNELISIIYFPAEEELEKSYLYFLIIMTSSEEENLDFWVQYHRYIESKWDTYWVQFFESELIPKLSINFRTKKSIEDKLLLLNTPEEPLQIVYDREDFFQKLKDSVITNKLEGNISIEGDTIWI